MNILLINPRYDENKASYLRMSGLPLGLLSIATYLNKNGHKASIADRCFCSDSFEELLNKYKPDIVGVSLIGNITILDAIEISDFFMGKKIPVVYGGTIASINPELILREGKADFVSIGEGEETWLELANALQNHTPVEAVAGLCFSNSEGKPFYTAERDFIDLAKTGAVDFSLISNIEKRFQTSYCYDKMLYLYLSKGCVGDCAFCFNHFFHRCKRRVRPVEDLLDEIEYLINNTGMKTVYFADELWGLYKEEREAFFDGIKKRKLKFIWGCQTRIGVLNEEDIKKMFDFGCRWIMFGIETPPGRLAKLANKNIPFDKIQPTLEACNRAKIITNISFIVNFPHSTEQDLRDTVEFALSLTPTFFSIHFFYPLENSILYNTVTEEGLFTPPETLRETAKRDMTDFIISEFSEVPNKDFSVIHSCFLLKAFFSKTPKTDDGASSFVWETIKGTLINIKSLSFAKWLKGLFSSGIYFLKVVSEALLHPLIRKKYGFHFGKHNKKSR